jgi:hypothetical protein
MYFLDCDEKVDRIFTSGKTVAIDYVDTHAAYLDPNQRTKRVHNIRLRSLPFHEEIK